MSHQPLDLRPLLGFLLNGSAQLRDQPLEPADVPGGFDPHPDPWSVQAAVKFLRFAVAVRKSPFVAFSGLSVDPSDLLKARVIITAYNQHVRLLPPEPWTWHYQVYSSVEGADAVMKSLVRPVRLEKV